MSIKVDASGPLRMIRAAIRALQPPNITAAVDAAVVVYQQGIQKRAPRKTGALARSFTRTVSGTSGQVSSDLIYAVPQEAGAFIAPKTGTTLKFAGSGGVHFQRKPIRLKAQPYVAPTFVSDSDKAFGAFAREIDQALD